MNHQLDAPYSNLLVPYSYEVIDDLDEIETMYAQLISQRVQQNQQIQQINQQQQPANQSDQLALLNEANEVHNVEQILTDSTHVQNYSPLQVMMRHPFRDVQMARNKVSSLDQFYQIEKELMQRIAHTIVEDHTKTEVLESVIPVYDLLTFYIANEAYTHTNQKAVDATKLRQHMQLMQLGSRLQSLSEQYQNRIHETKNMPYEEHLTTLQYVIEFIGQQQLKLNYSEVIESCRKHDMEATRQFFHKLLKEAMTHMHSFESTIIPPDVMQKVAQLLDKANLLTLLREVDHREEFQQVVKLTEDYIKQRLKDEV